MLQIAADRAPELGGLTMLQHPEITWIERTGHPSWLQEREASEPDEDAAYEVLHWAS